MAKKSVLDFFTLKTYFEAAGNRCGVGDWRVHLIILCRNQLELQPNTNYEFTGGNCHGANLKKKKITLPGRDKMRLLQRAN